MSVQEIKKELSALSEQERAEISAYLFHLRHASDPCYQAALKRRMDDKEPTHWLSPEEFEARLDNHS